VDVARHRYFALSDGCGSAPLGGNHSALDLTSEIVDTMERKALVPNYQQAFNWFHPTPALNRPPELSGVGRDIVEGGL
jgi:hypothetical protein